MRLLLALLCNIGITGSLLHGMDEEMPGLQGKRCCEPVADEAALTKRSKCTGKMDDLPPELLAQVLSFASHGMGKKEWEAWDSFSWVCKKFHAIASAWLQHDLLVSGEYDLFKQVIKIRAIAHEITSDDRSAISSGVKERQQPWPFWGQIKKGLCVEWSEQSCLNQLLTPWGLLTLNHLGLDDIRAPTGKKFALLFSLHLSMTFFALHGGEKFYDHDNGIWKDRNYHFVLAAELCMPSAIKVRGMFSIDKAVSLCRGGPLVVDCDSSQLFLAVNKIDQEQVAAPVYDAEWWSTSDYRSENCVKTLWRTLHQMHSKEQARKSTKMVRN